MPFVQQFDQFDQNLMNSPPIEEDDWENWLRNKFPNIDDFLGGEPLSQVVKPDYWMDNDTIMGYIQSEITYSDEITPHSNHNETRSFFWMKSSGAVPPSINGVQWSYRL